MKFKNRLKKIMICACTVAMILVSSVFTVFADEGGTSSVNDVIGGFEVPYYPDEIYDNEYIILYYDSGAAAGSEYGFMLLIFGSDCQPTLNVPYWQIANNSKPLHIKGLSSGSAYKCYSYSFDDGWVKVDGFNGEVYIQSGAKLSKTTVDLLLESDKSQVLVSANAEVIKSPATVVLLQNFGGMMSGFFNETEKNAVALFCFACVVGVGLIGILRQFISVRF